MFVGSCNKNFMGEWHSRGDLIVLPGDEEHTITAGTYCTVTYILRQQAAGGGGSNYSETWRQSNGQAGTNGFLTVGNTWRSPRRIPELLGEVWDCAPPGIAGESTDAETNFGFGTGLAQGGEITTPPAQFADIQSPPMVFPVQGGWGAQWQWDFVEDAPGPVSNWNRVPAALSSPNHTTDPWRDKPDPPISGNPDGEQWGRGGYGGDGFDDVDPHPTPGITGALFIRILN